MKRLGEYTKPTVLFVDMNSFFASCEQQVNYYLRDRPIAVCVYTGKQGCVIAPSIEAKRLGIRLGMRLDEAVKICPDLVPVETNSKRYREFHVAIIDVLRQFTPDVLPKSIDEAVVDLTRCQLMYKDVREVAQQIKRDIRDKVGDYLRCSIGIAPNAFLAKLGSDLQKPDGLVMITPETIDDVLRNLKLTDLPGIGTRMAKRLEDKGILTPLNLRYASPERLRAVCQSVIGWHWHLRLNFGGEVDLETSAYKSMQAMRTISTAQRRSEEQLDELLQSLCLTLERRMVRQDVFCQIVTFYCRYHDGRNYSDEVRLPEPRQDSMELYHLIRQRFERFQKLNQCEPILNHSIRSMSVSVFRFIPAQLVPFSLFEDNTRKNTLRKTVYEVKAKFGSDKLMRATELRDNPVFRDVIGFGSIKDLHDDQNPF
ncbi:DNA polymerase Y family protein [Larkinella punicea]|uniref:DNA polymerase IV n=1 Tax=Larkinella punicea TaxID=2315727 RepID=A0A368JK41_9BACT|nr:DNA polymerase IV [Larkinella punicea]RCR68018.1 DNA polymerase IV [Larkinella punicea]